MNSTAKKQGISQRINEKRLYTPPEVSDLGVFADVTTFADDPDCLCFCACGSSDGLKVDELP
jgi:hypothetical protein